MMNVHTPKPASSDKRHTPTLSQSGINSTPSEGSGGRFRAGTASVIINQ